MPPILYLTRLPRLVNLGQVELVGPVDQALGRLIIADLEGRGGCWLRLYYCAGLRRLRRLRRRVRRLCWLHGGGGEAFPHLTILRGAPAPAGLRLGSGWAPAPVNPAGGFRLPLPPTQL